MSDTGKMGNLGHMSDAGNLINKGHTHHKRSMEKLETLGYRGNNGKLIHKLAM